MPSTFSSYTKFLPNNVYYQFIIIINNYHSAAVYINAGWTKKCSPKWKFLKIGLLFMTAGWI